jgi:hypothetical protein
MIPRFWKEAESFETTFFTDRANIGIDYDKLHTGSNRYVQLVSFDDQR